VDRPPDVLGFGLGVRDAVDLAAACVEERDDAAFIGQRHRWADADLKDAAGGKRAFEGQIKIPRGQTVDDILIDPEASKVLTVDFVDVQQGDGCVVESPSGKVVLVDGGDNQMFARYLAARYRGTSQEDPREVEAIVVTHGDADHFSSTTTACRARRRCG
jgi:Metallo-beta-lactamase superfamily